MIWILTTNEPSAITVTVDGQLVGDYVDAVETSVNEAIKERSRVHLFLRDVSYIDEHGRKLLSRLATKGVELSASGVYSRHIVAEAGSKRAGPPGTMPTNGTPPRQATGSKPAADTRNKCGL
jgi:hypothetical protein